LGNTLFSHPIHEASLSLLLTFLWLIPCAWQDWRTGEVANWLTLPALALALLARLVGWTDAAWLVIFIMTGFSVLFWYKGILGGADAKGWITFTLLGAEVLAWAAVGQLAWYVVWKLMLRQQPRFAREVVMFPGFALGLGIGVGVWFFRHVGTFVP
jgi:Flp pilus assembly protein protease CpaA